MTSALPQKRAAMPRQTSRKRAAHSASWNIRVSEPFSRPPGAEILRQRLVAARNLLRDTDLPLDRIATKCGFCHASYLVSRFRRDTGLTPRAWRKLHGRSGTERRTAFPLGFCPAV